MADDLMHLDHNLFDFVSLTNDLTFSSAPVLSEDIWKKFELLDVPLNDFMPGPSSSTDEDCELDSLLDWKEPSCQSKSNAIRHHDCMWAGHCASKDHRPISCNRSISKTNTSVGWTNNTVKKPPTVVPTSSRSLLISSKINQNKNGHTKLESTKTIDSAPKIRPDTPQTSEDDSNDDYTPQLKQLVDYITSEKATVMQTLIEALSSELDDDDSDLCEQFYEDMRAYSSKQDTSSQRQDNEINSESSSEASSDEDEDEQIEQLNIYNHQRTMPAEADHCYHLSKSRERRLENLGVQTPSDSEEEIDVVSVLGDTVIPETSPRNLKAPLPTNPSIFDRQTLQMTVATAITNNRRQQQQTPNSSIPSNTSGGIKTRLPSSRTSNQQRNTEGESTPRSQRGPKKRSATTEGRFGRNAKRARQACRYKTSPKKRSSGDSDSECDSEKRSLHNNMERQRRIDLRNAFEDLRVLVPGVCSKERAAKVVILREAAVYCDVVRDVEEKLLKKKDELKRHQDMLMAKVSHLRRLLAAKR